MYALSRPSFTADAWIVVEADGVAVLRDRIFMLLGLVTVSIFEVSSSGSTEEDGPKA